MMLEGTLKVPAEHLIGFITEDGTAEERGDEVELKGKGEVAVSSTQLPGDLLGDTGEGQLMIELSDEKMIIKVNPEEKVFYKNSPFVRWFKL